MRSWAWVMAASLSAVGCDAGGTKVAPDAGSAPVASASSKPAPTAAPAPQPRRAPVISLDDRGCTIDGVAFEGEPSDWRDRAAVVLRDARLVAGEVVAVDVMRDVKLPKVAAIVAALADAKAKTALVRTPTRDQSTGEVELTLRHGAVADCSAVAMIEHDGAVALWSRSGGGAQRFTRGMAGPDLTASTEVLKKHAAACDSPAWFVSAADTTSWGLVFDLMTRAKAAPDGGSALRPGQTVLLTHPPVPGRRVKDD